jgi:hypothetical protein
MRNLINAILHYCLAAFGFVLFAVAWLEAIVLIDHPVHCGWAVAALFLSSWFTGRMLYHAQRLGSAVPVIPSVQPAVRPARGSGSARFSRPITPQQLGENQRGRWSIEPPILQLED